MAPIFAGCVAALGVGWIARSARAPADWLPPALGAALVALALAVGDRLAAGVALACALASVGPLRRQGAWVVVVLLVALPGARVGGGRREPERGRRRRARHRGPSLPRGAGAAGCRLPRHRAAARRRPDPLPAADAALPRRPPDRAGGRRGGEFSPPHRRHLRPGLHRDPRGRPGAAARPPGGQHGW